MNTNTKTNPPQDAVTLAEETISFGGMLLEYRLLVRNTYADRFRVTVALGEERAESGVGNDIEAALGRFRSVVHGRVTPCTLSEVLCDLCRS